MIRVGERQIDITVGSDGPTGTRPLWGVNHKPRAAASRQRGRRRAPELAPGVKAEESRCSAERRATAQRTQRRLHSSLPVGSVARSATSGARPVAGVARLLKLHALGPHCEVDHVKAQRPEPLSDADQRLIANAGALFGTGEVARSRKSSENELKERPRSAVEDRALRTQSPVPIRTKAPFRPTYRSWVPPDKAHEAFMRSINRERFNFDKFADEETERRDSVWLGWSKPDVAPQKAPRIPTRAEQIRESLRRPTGRGFNGAQWDRTNNFQPDEVQPDPKRAEALLTRTRASMIGYAYDHQGYV